VVFTYDPDNEWKKLAMQVDYTPVSTRYYNVNNVKSNQNYQIQFRI